MKVSKNFESEEFLSKETHDYLVSKGISVQWFVDKQMVEFCEWLKAKCNNAKVIINDWKWKGQYNYSGLRSPKDIGAEYSQHKFMNAVDIKVDGYTPTQLRQSVVDNFSYINKEFGITTIEKIKDTPTWLHVDKRWTGLTYLLEVNG